MERKSSRQAVFGVKIFAFRRVWFKEGIGIIREEYPKAWIRKLLIFYE